MKRARKAAELRQVIMYVKHRYAMQIGMAIPRRFSFLGNSGNQGMAIWIAETNT